MLKKINISNYNIGDSHPSFIIAEIGINHNGDLDLAKKIENAALSLGLDAIIEVHNEKEINDAIKFNSNLIGINNRNLKDFTVDINNAIRLANSIETDKILISESGINSKSDINQTITNSSIRTFLIGESLMRSKDIRAKFNNLIN